MGSIKICTTVTLQEINFIATFIISCQKANDLCQFCNSFFLSSFLNLFFSLIILSTYSSILDVGFYSTDSGIICVSIDFVKTNQIELLFGKNTIFHVTKRDENVLRIIGNPY